MSEKAPMDAAGLLVALKELTEAVGAGSSDKAVKLMERMRAEVTPTEELLRTTKAGSVLAKLRKDPNPGVSNMAKDVVQAWKDIIDSQRKRKREAEETSGKPAAPPKKVKTETSEPPNPAVGTSASPGRDIKPLTKSTKSESSNTQVKTEIKAESNDIKPKLEGTATASGSRAGSEKPKAEPKFETIDKDRKTLRTAKMDAMGEMRADLEGQADNQADPVRDKCVVMIYDALAGDSTASKEIIAERAVSLERAVYQQFDYSTNNDYRSKMRSLYLNLKDKGNPGLRDKIVMGTLDTATIVNMSKSDMASASVKAMNEKLAEANLFKAKNVTEVQAETTAFKCSKCHQRRCSFYQMQTRSADEPMTTFATCLNCNHKWKFC